MSDVVERAEQWGRELDAEIEARPADAPAPRPAVRTGSFAAPGGPKTLADEAVS